MPARPTRRLNVRETQGHFDRISVVGPERKGIAPEVKGASHQGGRIAIWSSGRSGVSTRLWSFR